MSYTLPSVRIYQLLENSGGAVRSTPDLDTVLIGPLYNIESMIFNPNFPQCPAVPATLAEWQTYKANTQYSYFTVTYFRGVIT